MNNIVQFVLLFVISYCTIMGIMLATLGESPDYPIACWVSNGISGLLFYCAGGHVVYQEMKK